MEAGKGYEYGDGQKNWNRKCQISFFGMRETNDWFYRRKVFLRCYLATEDFWMLTKPRWQLFLTKKIIPELEIS